MKYAQLVTTTVVLILLLPTVQAIEGASFDIGTTQQKTDFCNCDELIDYVTITNTGQYDATYTLSTNIPDKADLSQNQVFVEAGNTIEIPVVISGDCQSETTTFDYKIVVESNLGGEKAYERTLRSFQCQTIQANLYGPNKSINPCTPTNYTIEITNPSTFQERYNITTPSQNINLAKESLSIDSGQIQKVNATTNFSCDVYGTQNIKFNIEAQTSGLIASLRHDLKIKQAYNHTLTTQPIQACKDETYTTTQEITNNNHFNDTYDLRLRNNPSNVELRSKEITLQPNETQPIPIRITNLQQDIDRTIQLQATSRKGNIVKTKPINLTTQTCYDLQTTFTTQQTNYCPGSHTTPIQITNNAQPQTLTLSSNEELNQTTLYLQHNETQQITLTHTNQRQQGTSQKTIWIQPHIQNKNVTKDFNTSQQITYYSQQACTQPNIDPTKTAAYNTNQTQLTITNNGAQPTRYSIQFTNTPIFIEERVDIITLEPNEKQTLTYDLTATQEDIGTYTYTIQATSLSNNQTYNQNATLEITDKSFFTRFYNAIQTNQCTQIITATAILAILFIITVLTLKTRGKTYAKNKIIGTILMIASILILITFLLYGPPTLTQNPNTNIVLDSTQTINLDALFSQNYTTYAITTQPQSVQSTIQSNQLTLIPVNLTENTYIQIEGRSTTRTELTTLTINTTTPPSTYEQNCPWIVLLILIITSLFTLLLTKKESETDGKDDTPRNEEDEDKLNIANTDEEKPFDKAPNSNSTKKEMKHWLDYHNVDYHDDMLKDELYELIKEEKEKNEKNNT